MVGIKTTLAGSAKVFFLSPRVLNLSPRVLNVLVFSSCLASGVCRMTFLRPVAKEDPTCLLVGNSKLGRDGCQRGFVPVKSHGDLS